MPSMRDIFLFFAFMLISSVSFAVPTSINYQGRILKPNGQPLEYFDVSFLFQIVSPDGTCVLFQEQKSGVNMVNSGGVFDLSIGNNSQQYLASSATQVLDVFKNTGTFECATCAVSGPGYSCSGSGSFYSPLAGDLRRLRVSFHDGTGWKVITPDNEIRTVPYAAYAARSGKIGSLGESDLLTKALAPLCVVPNSFLQWNGLDFDCVAMSSVATSPGGSDGQIQFNNSGTFSASANLFWDNNLQRMGIGTSNPAEALTVNGAIQVGPTATGCSTVNKGAIRYNNATNVLEFCNGSGWNLVQAAACSDATPSTVAFANEANASLSSTITSNPQQVTGINCSVPVSISGQGTPQFQICADGACATVIQSWTSSPSSISNNQYIQVRLTTDSVGGATYQATIIIGSGASVWSVTNSGGDCSGTPAIGSVCADGTIYAGISPDGNVKMFTTRCDAGQTWDGVSCTGIRSVMGWNNGSSNWGYTGYTSTVTGKSNSAGLNALADSASPHVSAAYCESLALNGHTDWYLPALGELSVLYSNRGAIRNFTSTRYWSSSDTTYNISIAQVLEFSTGAFATDLKYNNHNVRCVRR